MTSPSILASETTPEGKELVLHQRDGVVSLRLDGLELMTSRIHGSEEVLARLACRGLETASAPRILIGGLGFGYTLRAALDHLPADARVLVAEVFPSLLDWNRSFLAELAARPLDDPRVDVVRSDVWEHLDRQRRFDAILLDVDNGPRAFTLETNERLYRAAGLRRLRASLQPGGRLAVWSAEPGPGFGRRLRRAGFEVERARVPVRGADESEPRAGHHHTLFLGIQSRS